MKAPLFIISILILPASTLANQEKKINVTERLKQIEEKSASRERDYDVEKIVREVDDFIQNRCLKRKVPPTLPILQDHVDGLSYKKLSDSPLPAEVKVSSLDVKYYDDKSACVGKVHVKSAPLGLSKTYELPIKHETDVKPGFWSLRK